MRESVGVGQGCGEITWETCRERDMRMWRDMLREYQQHKLGWCNWYEPRPTRLTEKRGYLGGSNLGLVYMVVSIWVRMVCVCDKRDETDAIVETTMEGKRPAEEKWKCCPA